MPLTQWGFGISTEATTFARRGFRPGDPNVQHQLETAGRAFVDGYNAGLTHKELGVLTARLNALKDQFRGFAFEGAAMALALLDLLTPWNRSRLSALIQTPVGDRHLYMLHVGAGWAIARVPWARRRFETSMSRLQPLYRWLALDGYGFHEGFFHTVRYLEEQKLPRGLSPSACRVFDQGLGRSLWFSHCGDAERIHATVSQLALSRQGDLWSGVGLAASYAGGVQRRVLEELRERASGFRAHLAQGAAFAAKARARAENQAEHTGLACQVFCGTSAELAAAVTDDCLRDLPANGLEPEYETWRRRIRDRFSARQEPAAPAGVPTRVSV